jgi:outer membrane protein assembly factor BamB
MIRIARASLERWRLSVPVAVSAFALLSGCESLRTGANPEVPLWVHHPSWAMDLEYSRNVVARTRREGEPYERGQPELDIRGRRVFVGSSDHGLYALRATDGHELWRFETLGFVQCEPLYDPNEDVVYFGSNDGALYKVSAATGQLLWRFFSNAEVARRPVLYRGVLYVVNANDTAMAIRARSGKLVWSRHRAPAMGMETAGYSGPLVWRGKVYVGFSDGNVAAFDAQSGDDRWPAVDLAAEAEELLGELPQYLDVDTTPVAGEVDAQPVVFVGSYVSGVHALDAETGGTVWHNPTVAGVTELLLWQQPAHPSAPHSGATLPARELLIAATGTTGLWALDPQTGQEVWRRSLPRGGVSAPVPVAGALAVSASQLGLFLVSPIDGQVIDGIHMQDGASMTPAAFGRRLFVVSNGGLFLGIHLLAPTDHHTRGS